MIQLSNKNVISNRRCYEYARHQAVMEKQRDEAVIEKFAAENHNLNCHDHIRMNHKADDISGGLIG